MGNMKIFFPTGYYRENGNYRRTLLKRNYFILGLILFNISLIPSYVEFSDECSRLKNENLVMKDSLHAVGLGGFDKLEKGDYREYSNYIKESIKEKLSKYCINQYHIAIPGFDWPIPDPEKAYTYKDLSEYGWRWMKIKGEWVKDFHAGIDIVSPYDYRVLSVYDGKVIDVGYNLFYGSFIRILHKIKGKKYISTYAHLSAVYVSENEEIKKGDMIGMIGESGHPDYVKGIHLHFSIQDPVLGSMNFVMDSIHGKKVSIEHKWKW